MDCGVDHDCARLQESLGIAARNSSSISSFCGGNSWCYSCNTLKINGALQRIDNAPCAMPTACVAMVLTIGTSGNYVNGQRFSVDSEEEKEEKEKKKRGHSTFIL